MRIYVASSWRDNFSRFDQMIKSTYQVSRRVK